VSDDLTRRLQALEDERAVLATLYRYAHALDYGDETAWVDCFTADARYELRDPAAVSAADRPRVHHGREDLARFVANHTRAPERFHKHLLVEPVIAVTGDTATASSYFMRVDDRDGVPTIYAFGRYLDALVRSADGRWRFAVRIAEIESRRAESAPRRDEL
jgi:ketosteroid isomerase-like protein